MRLLRVRFFHKSLFVNDLNGAHGGSRTRHYGLRELNQFAHLYSDTVELMKLVKKTTFHRSSNIW